MRAHRCSAYIYIYIYIYIEVSVRARERDPSYTIYSRFLRCLNTTTTIDRLCSKSSSSSFHVRFCFQHGLGAFRSFVRSNDVHVAPSPHSPALSSVVSFSRARSGTSRSVWKRGRGRSRVVHRRLLLLLLLLLSSFVFFLKRHQRWWWCPSAASPSSKRTCRWRRRNPFASIAPSPRRRPTFASTARSTASDRTRAPRERTTT